VTRVAGVADACPHTYAVYGLRIRSAWPLPYPSSLADGIGEVSLVQADKALFEEALQNRKLPETSAPWVSAVLHDGSTYLRWSGIFEFLIAPDGRWVHCRPLTSSASEAFHTHLGPSLSFALINLGVEPLHSTTVVIDDGAVALMGDCGYGKSSLGAAFLKRGHRLLTDDLLVVRAEGSSFVAYPGAPRVKLFPELAREVLGEEVEGLRLPALTPKMIIPLDGAQASHTVTPLKAIYVLSPPSRRARARSVRIRRLSQRQAFLELVRNTFNMAVTDPARLQRQFLQATQLAAAIPVKVLSYPRVLDMLPVARDAIVADLNRGRSGETSVKTS